MKKEAFQEIAKHFAESIKVSLRFEVGAVPRTNGSEIVLPTEMSEAYIDETLGALLHETNHIRYTDMEYFSELDRLTREVTNVVEDIRVDSKSLKLYPNSRCFYMVLIEDVLKTKMESIQKEPLPFKVLKALILAGFGVDAKRVYGTCDDWADIEKHLANLLPLMTEIKECPDTKSTAPIVSKIILELFKDKDKEKKPGKNEKSEDGESSGNGESQGDGNDQNKSEDPLGDITENVGEYHDTVTKDNKLKAKYDELAAKYNEHVAAYNKACRSKKTYNTKLRNLERDLRWGNIKPNAEQKAKKDKYEQAIKDRADTMNKENTEFQSCSQEKHAISTKREKLEDKVEKIKDTMNGLLDQLFSTTDYSNLLGFNALDKDKLLDKNYVDVPYNQNLDELIKEVLIVKQEEYQQDDTGRLDMRKLHEVFTDPESMFIEKEDRQLQTRVNFVVDVSGSMSGYGAGEEYREDLCSHALNIIAESFKKAIKAGAPGEMKVFAFGNDIYEAVPDAEHYKPISRAEFTKWRDVAGGSTNLSNCVNLVVNEVSNDSEFRNVLVIMTDAEVDDRELEMMINNISTGDVRVLYIAIASRLATKEAQELFGSNNITNKENAVQILQNVMLQGIYTLR